MFYVTGCIIHQDIFNSIILFFLIYIAFVIISLWLFSLSNKDIVAFAIMFLGLCILGGRFLLLGAGLADKLYDESQCYANLLMDEKNNLISTFPFIQKIEDPDNQLRRPEAKNIPLQIDCNQEITDKQCEQVEKFIMTQISSMGGGPYAGLQLSVAAPLRAGAGEMHPVYVKNITLEAQNKVYDFKLWVSRNFVPNLWLGTLSLLMLAYLLTIGVFYVCLAPQSYSIRFLFSFAIISSVVFGGFYLVNNFYHQLIYCHILSFLIAPYALLCLGCLVARLYCQKKQASGYINLLTQFFTLVSVLCLLFLLFAN